MMQNSTLHFIFWKKGRSEDVPLRRIVGNVMSHTPSEDVPLRRIVGNVMSHTTSVCLLSQNTTFIPIFQQNKKLTFWSVCHWDSGGDCSCAIWMLENVTYNHFNACEICVAIVTLTLGLRGLLNLCILHLFDFPAFFNYWSQKCVGISISSPTCTCSSTLVRFRYNKNHFELYPLRVMQYFFLSLVIFNNTMDTMQCL